MPIHAGPVLGTGDVGKMKNNPDFTGFIVLFGEDKQTEKNKEMIRLD